MKLFYKCEFFKIEELVDEVIFKRWGDDAWMFFRPEALISLDGIRSYFNKPVTVNNWAIGGPFQNRGLRAPYSLVGGEYSQHRFGNAFDLDVKDLGVEEVRREILLHRNEPSFSRITCLEIGVTWIHFDCRNIPDRIRLVSP